MACLDTAVKYAAEWLISLENNRNHETEGSTATSSETGVEVSEEDEVLLDSLQALVFTILTELRKREPLPIAKRIAHFLMDMIKEEKT